MIFFWHKIKNNNFDPYNVLLAIATNIPCNLTLVLYSRVTYHYLFLYKPTPELKYIGNNAKTVTSIDWSNMTDTMWTPASFWESLVRPVAWVFGVCYSPAVIAVEVVRMVRVILENQRDVINDGLTFLADVLPQTVSLLTVVTWTAQVSVNIKLLTQLQFLD